MEGRALPVRITVSALTSSDCGGHAGACPSITLTAKKNGAPLMEHRLKVIFVTP